MIAARRRSTGLLTARLARRLIDQLALWCVEVELATDRIETAELSAGAEPAADQPEGRPRALAMTALAHPPRTAASCPTAWNAPGITEVVNLLGITSAYAAV